jgi:ATP-binding cassette subfamily C (CFTR/MRP) protein 1
LKIIKKQSNKLLKIRYLELAIGRYISTHLEQLASIIVFGVAISSIIFRHYFNPLILALSLNFSILIATYMNDIFNNYIEFNLGMVSVERIKEYSELNPEPERIKINDKSLIEWPKNGNIVFENVFLKYESDLSFVLKDISFKIKNNEKIGISKLLFKQQSEEQAQENQL